MNNTMEHIIASAGTLHDCNCNSTDVNLWHNEGVFYVKCRECGLSGDVHKHSLQAMGEWNNTITKSTLRN